MTAHQHETALFAAQRHEEAAAQHRAGHDAQTTHEATARANEATDRASEADSRDTEHGEPFNTKHACDAALWAFRAETASKRAVAEDSGRRALCEQEDAARAHDEAAKAHRAAAAEAE